MALWALGKGSARPMRSPHRLSLRAAVAVPARVAPAEASDVFQTRAVVENLSDRGTLLRSVQRFREGDRVRLCLRPGTDARLNVAGQIIHARSRRYQAESLYGLRFVDVTEEQAQALTSYVRELMLSQYREAL